MLSPRAALQLYVRVGAEPRQTRVLGIKTDELRLGVDGASGGDSDLEGIW